MKAHKAVVFAVLAAICYGVSSPFSKLLLAEIPPALMASLLYLGAGFGMAAVSLLGKIRRGGSKEARMTKRELPCIAGMIALDVAAPVLLMFGLNMTTPANAALLNNFEIVATSLIALLVFKEAVGRRMWIAIALITASSAILSFEDAGSLSFSAGSLLVVLACLCWGLENNCTKMLSMKDPLQIVVIKGLGSGAGSLAIAAASKELRFNALYISFALLLGFFAYGLSIYFYILAQRELGAARTSAYYTLAPFIGAGLSFIFFRQPVTAPFAAAFAIMLAGAYFAAVERHGHSHTHDAVEHEHRHSHSDGHHNHRHDFPIGEHSHMHSHDNLVHAHHHTPDTHHTHTHKR